MYRPSFRNSVSCGIASRVRDIAVLDDPDEQRARFRALVGDTVVPSVRVALTVVAARDGG